MLAPWLERYVSLVRLGCGAPPLPYRVACATGARRNHFYQRMALSAALPTRDGDPQHSGVAWCGLGRFRGRQARSLGRPRGNAAWRPDALPRVLSRVSHRRRSVHDNLAAFSCFLRPSRDAPASCGQAESGGACSVCSTPHTLMHVVCYARKLFGSGVSGSCFVVVWSCVRVFIVCGCLTRRSPCKGIWRYASWLVNMKGSACNLPRATMQDAHVAALALQQAALPQYVVRSLTRLCSQSAEPALGCCWLAPSCSCVRAALSKPMNNIDVQRPRPLEKTAGNYHPTPPHVCPMPSLNTPE